MKKIRLILFLVSGYWFLVTSAYALEQIQILTYYPAPFGVYQTIRAGTPKNPADPADKYDHFLVIDYITDWYRIYPTSYGVDTMLIGHTASSSDITIGGNGVKN